jgi:hypothetical protein
LSEKSLLIRPLRRAKGMAVTLKQLSIVELAATAPQKASPADRPVAPSGENEEEMITSVRMTAIDLRIGFARY